MQIEVLLQGQKVYSSTNHFLSSSLLLMGHLKIGKAFQGKEELLSIFLRNNSLPEVGVNECEKVQPKPSCSTILKIFMC